MRFRSDTEDDPRDEEDLADPSTLDRLEAECQAAGRDPQYLAQLFWAFQVANLARPGGQGKVWPPKEPEAEENWLGIQFERPSGGSCKWRAGSEL